MKVKFFTLGCKVNQYESQALAEEFERHGFIVCDREREADLYVVNGCTVTSRAQSKTRHTVLNLKKQNPEARVAVIGCVAELNHEEVKAWGADYVLGQSHKYNLLETVLGKPLDKEKTAWSLGISRFFNHRAFVKVQDGCDNFCSYCKIPYLRGTPRSRPFKEVIEEVARLSPAHPEIILCGTNLSRYGRDLVGGENLTSLISGILEVKSLGRLRLSSIEPSALDNEFLELLTRDKFCPHLHIPFQSGDDKILVSMNRKETTGQYLEIVEKARKKVPDLAISCDLIVGFPGEDEDSFTRTGEFIKRIRPMRTHLFSFSPRDYTAFHEYRLRNQARIKERYIELRTLTRELAREYSQKFLNKSLFMVTEKGHRNYVDGYTENYLKVLVSKELPLGRLLKVKITKIHKDSIYACPETPLP